MDSVDMLRGLVMVIMALDHTRGFFSNVTFYPMDLSQTTPALFWTRWITHLCAPVFIFLAGTGAFLSTSRGKTPRELAWFLVTRGLWLVFLEITVVRCLGWTFNFDLRSVGAAVIWAIGWSMVVLAGLVFLRIELIAFIGVSMIAMHNAFDHVRPEAFGDFAWLWHILHQPGGKIEWFPGSTLSVGYPLIPWIGVMAAGYAFGKLLLLDVERRRRWIFRIGAAATLLFIVLRASNLYGDPNPWSEQKSALFTFFSFVNCQKYPPSLLYLLMTLGPALMLLAAIDRPLPAALRPIIVFGRVPLFYYLLHLPVIHGLAVLFAFVRYGEAGWLYGTYSTPRPQDYGYNLPVVYFLWVLVVVMLYPLCRWFADLKRRRREAWLSYF